MHEIAPNCVSNFENFPGGDTPDPHPWGGGHPLPRRGTPTSQTPPPLDCHPERFIFPPETNGWVKP